MQETQAQNDNRERARAAILALAPGIEATFGPMIELGLANLTDEQLAELATGMENAKTEEGVNMEALAAFGKLYGVSPEMVAMYGGTGATDTL